MRCQCEQELTDICNPTPSFQVIGQYDDVECMLTTCVLHDDSKRGCYYQFVVERTIEGALFCDVP